MIKISVSALAWSFLLMTFSNNPVSSKDPRTTKTTSDTFTDETISLDSGNKMITSYVNSIGGQDNDTDLRSIIIDSKQLRDLLNTDSGHRVKQLKISFAHTLLYINSGHGNHYAGYRSGALTVILSGVDSLGNYVFTPANMAIDRGVGCPTNCPVGTAGYNLLGN